MVTERAPHVTRRLAVVLVAATALVAGLLGPAAARPPQPGPAFPILGEEPTDADNVVLKWNETLLATIRLARAPTTATPTVNARALAIMNTAIYDAWAAYDVRARATRPNPSGAGEQPPSDTAGKQAAISHAAYTVLTSVRPYDGLRMADGKRPADVTLAALYPTYDPSSVPVRVGRGAAEAVLAARAGDRSNESGNYADTSGYVPRGSYANDAGALRWQPLTMPNGALQQAQVPHWGDVTGFGLPADWQSDRDFVPAGPRTNNGNLYKQQARDIVAYGQNLTPVQKACAVYWADGVSSETPPGHWDLIAQAVSRRDGHTLDEDVALFFALGNALHNAGVVSWEAKYRYDFARPATLIRYLYESEKPKKRDPAMQDWTSYIATPPFPEYTSGHSTFSAAAAEVLRTATGSDRMGMATVVPANFGSQYLSPGKQAPTTAQTLSWATFTDAVGGPQGSGISRLYGGIHFDDANEHGQDAGTAAGEAAWDAAQLHVTGATGY